MPRFSSLTRPAAFSTERWCEMVAPVASNRAHSSPALISPWRSSSRMRRRVGSARALNVASNSMAVHPPLPQFDGLLNISIARAAPARKHRAKKCTKNTKKQPAKSSKQALDSQNSTRSFVESFSTPCGKPCVKPAPMGPKSGFSGGFSTLSTGFSTLKWNKMASTRRITRRWPLCGNGGACLVLT